jgi:O-antigen/teichoic acid export membrane protein
MNFIDNSLFNKFLSNHVLKFIAGGVNFLLIALIARLSNPDILGEFSTIYAGAILISSIAFWGMSDGLILLKKKFNLFELILNSSVIISFNGLLSFFIILLNFQDFSVYYNIFIGLTVISILYINLFSTVSRLVGNYKQSIYFGSIQDKIIFIFVMTVLFFQKGKLSIIDVLNSYFFSYIFSFFICLCFAVYHFQNSNIIVKTKSLTFFNIRYIYKHNNPLLISSLVNNFTGTIDVLILNNFLSFSQIANYKVASTFAKLIKISLSSFSNYMLPELSKMIDEKSHQTNSYILNNYNYIFISSITLILFIVIFADNLIYAIYGPDYNIAYSLLLILLIGYSYNNLSGPNGTILLSLKKTYTLLVIDLVTTIFGVLLLYYLTKYFSLWGSVIANVLMIILYNYLKNIVVIKHVKIYQIVLKKISISWSILVVIIIFFFIHFYTKTLI